jgi:hypothetical protein
VTGKIFTLDLFFVNNISILQMIHKRKKRKRKRKEKKREKE